MRTYVGPICRSCLEECERVVRSSDSGYMHGEWVHKVKQSECPRIDVDWVPLKEYERATSA